MGSGARLDADESMMMMILPPYHQLYTNKAFCDNHSSDPVALCCIASERLKSAAGASNQ